MARIAGVDIRVKKRWKSALPTSTESETRLQKALSGEATEINSALEF